MKAIGEHAAHRLVDVLVDEHTLVAFASARSAVSRASSIRAVRSPTCFSVSSEFVGNGGVFLAPARAKCVRGKMKGVGCCPFARAAMPASGPKGEPWGLRPR